MSYQSRILLSLGAALLFGAMSAQAQTAEEIVKKHNEAVGGAAAWKKVNSLRMTGSTSIQGMDIPVVVSKLRNTGVRQDLEIMGTKNYVIFTPTQGWMLMAVQGQSEPKEFPAEVIKLSEAQTFLGDPIMEMGDHGYKFESAGISTLDGKPVVPGKGTAEADQYYRLKALDKDGNATDLYLDMKSYNLVKTSRMVKMEGEEHEAASSYANYQKQAEGIVIPMSITSEQGELKLTKIEVNPKLEATYFKP